MILFPRFPFASRRRPAWVLAVAALCTAGGAAGQLEARPVEMIVVSEVSADAGALPRPVAGTPVGCFLADAGYIEAGDPVAGLTPPTAASVAEALAAALGRAGYQPVSDRGAPSVLLMYHWGSLAPRRFGHTTMARLDPNLRARLSLVTNERTVQRLEDRLTLRKAGVRSLDEVVNVPSERDALEYARDTRYFIAIAAYDFAALTRGEIRPLWRTRLSAAENTGGMNEVILSLAAVSGQYVGQDLRRPLNERVPLVAGGPGIKDGNPGAVPLPDALTAAVDADWLRGWMRNEHLRYAGEYGARSEGEFNRRQAGARPATPLPAALARRIDSYQQEQRALQDLLARQLRERSAAERPAVIAAFHSQQQERLAALDRLGESIRTELTAHAARQPAPDKTVEQLLRELSAGVRALENAALAQQP